MFGRLAATTGARRGEILGLSWADVDLENGRLRLVYGLIDAAGGPVLQERKAKNANCVDLDAETLRCCASIGTAAQNEPRHSGCRLGRVRCSQRLSR